MFNTIMKVKLIQKAVGTLTDGKLGPHTIDSILKWIISVTGEFVLPTPYASKFFGCYTITADPDDIRLIDAKGRHGVGTFKNSMSGSFTVVQRNGERRPISILINDGKVLRYDSCHSFDLGKPETVLYYLYNGTYGMQLARYASDLPDNVKWAIGGGQLIRNGEARLNNVAEGFTGVFSDVLRTAQHNAIGFDKYGNVIGVMHTWCSMARFQQKCKSMGLVDAIFVDGGSISAMNSELIRYKKSVPQGYVVQFGGNDE